MKFESQLYNKYKWKYPVYKNKNIDLWYNSDLIGQSFKGHHCEFHKTLIQSIWFSFGRKNLAGWWKLDGLVILISEVSHTTTIEEYDWNRHSTVKTNTLIKWNS